MKKFLFRRIGVADDQPSARPSLHDCIEVVLMQGDALLADVLDGLAAASAKTKGLGSYGNQTPVSKTITDLLSSQAAAMKKTFMAKLREGVYNSGAQEAAEQPLLRFEDLQLLDTQQIDASIELALAQQEVARCVDDVLPTLNALISGLLGWITVQAHHNPLKPEVFVRALHACLVQYAPDEQARAALIIPASGLLGVSLRQLYREICDWLVSQGVEQAMPVGAPMPNTGAAASTKGAQSSVVRTMVTLDKLRKLLSGEFESAASGVPNFMHTVPASFEALEDMKLVEPMMKRLAQRAAQPAAAPVKSDAPAPQVAREQTQRRQLGQQLGEEVVRMMLDNLMQDQRLLLKVRELIQTLEPVLLKLSQSDPRFFSERQHPARQFLDRLTHRSLGYTTENDERFFRFLKSLSEAVGVLIAGDGSAAAFAQVLRELEAGWAGEEAVQRQQHEEAARALLQVEQRNLLAQSLANDFQERLKDKEVPELVANFLRGPWAQVVAQSRLSCADGRVDPDGYLALVDELIWSVQLRLTRRNRTRLVQLVPKLLVTLRHGLQFIQYPEERVPVFFDALISWHEKAFDGPPARTAAADPLVEVGEDLPDEVLASQVAADAHDATGFWVAEDEAQESGYLAPDAQTAPENAPHAWSVGELNTGAWVELLVDGGWLRAQLTWASPHRTLFMFISQGGLAHSMSRRSMERLRMQGSIRVVSDGHVLDNALDAVARTALENDMGQVEQRS